MRHTLIADIASTLQSWRNCIEAKNSEWEDRHYARLRELQDELPSGCGIDCGTKIDFDKSTSQKIILTFSFHHMNGDGIYDGWSDHTAIVTPAFDGIDIRITGRDRNGIKEMLYDQYYWCLMTPRHPDGIYCDDDIYQKWMTDRLTHVAELFAVY